VAFRQQIGPAASSKQVARLLVLLQEAGHVDFRAARGPLGFSQRQGLGKFTQAEAAALIDQLEEEGADGGNPSVVTADVPPARTNPRLASVATDDLVAELRRRGWVGPGPS
jgi:hypothetical protein